MKTEGRPQEIIQAIVRRNETENTTDTIDHIFLSWLWEDFQTLTTHLQKGRREQMEADCRAVCSFCAANYKDPPHWAITKQHGVYLHNGIVVCLAAAIRQALEEEA